MTVVVVVERLSTPPSSWLGGQEYASVVVKQMKAQLLFA